MAVLGISSVEHFCSTIDLFIFLVVCVIIYLSYVPLQERELFQRKRPQKDDKQENASHQRTLVTKNDGILRDQHGMSDVRDVTIVTRKNTDVPPPPPPVSH